MSSLAAAALALGAALAGALVGYLFAGIRAAAALVKTQSELAGAQAALATERENAAVQAPMLETRFKQLAQDILEDKSRRFTDQNRENLEQILKPLRERISGFEQQVRDTYDKETRDRVALFQQIRSLQDLNQKVAEDARDLTTALKGQSKTQGNWGEMILERILEQSGLTRGREYETQFTARAEDGGRRRPDAVVHLPDHRDIVIDAKVSLAAFVRATEAGTDEAHAAALAEHVASVRTHVQSLSAKEYQNLDGLQTLDFVLMFVPSEAAYIEAVRTEPRLFEEALARNIGLVCPSTLLPTLRTVENLWRFERQSRNAADIADKAGRLYNKFVGLVDDLDKLGRALDTTGKAYQAARNKLSEGRGSLVDRAEELKQLGAKTSKQLPKGTEPESLPAATDDG
ncbi:MAG: DNA recombination protein RmuC [Nevskiales bacterium]|nr:DNA recombination protein RmuC [Nevskiales bacterium]